MALALGYKSRARMLDDLTMAEYIEWCRVGEEQPFTLLRDEFNASRIVQAMIGVATHGKHWPEIVDLAFKSARKAEADGVDLAETVKAHMDSMEPIILGANGKPFEVE